MKVWSVKIRVVIRVIRKILTDCHIACLEGKASCLYYFSICCYFLTVIFPSDSLYHDLKPSQLHGKVGRKELIMKSRGTAAKML